MSIHTRKKWLIRWLIGHFGVVTCWLYENLGCSEDFYGVSRAPHSDRTIGGKDRLVTLRTRSQVTASITVGHERKKRFPVVCLWGFAQMKTWLSLLAIGQIRFANRFEVSFSSPTEVNKQSRLWDRIKILRNQDGNFRRWQIQLLSP